MRRWVGLALLAFALTVSISRAEPVPGLTVSAYEIGQIPPSRSDLLYPLCATPPYGNVNQNWGGGSVAGCRADRVMVHYAGFIQIPEHESLQFYLVSDDGGWLQVGNWEFGYWRDRGCWGSQSGSIDIPAGVYEFHNWFYENGGGACNVLYWSVDGGAWEVVPESAFIPASSPSTSSSSVVIPATTTTEESTTTSTSSTSTTSSPSTLFVTSSTVAETTTAPTSTAVTTTYAATSSSDVSTTAVQDTEPLPTTVVQETTTTGVSATTATSVLTKILPNSTTSITARYTPTTATTTTTTSPVEPPKTPVETTNPPTPTTTPPVTPEAYSGAQAVEAASNPALLATATAEQAAMIFSNLNENDLTAEDGARIVKAVQNAPTEVRQTFEQQVNIFAGATDTYVPLGSKVPVGTRRVVVASTLLVVTPVPKGKRK